MKTFNDFWQLLAPGSEYDGMKRSCEKMWNSFNPERQELIYQTIAEKITMGKFMDYNPYYALQKNANPMPKFLDGFEQEEAWEMGLTLAVVNYQRKCLCCTIETAKAHKLEIVNYMSPLPKPKRTPEEELEPFTIDYSIFHFNGK